MFNNRKKVIINIIAVIIFLVLPYFIFKGRLFIGGDDTRLFYIYPSNWISNIGVYSWFHLSSFSISNPNQFIIPLLFLINIVQNILGSNVIADYFFFSLPMLFGFLGFQILFIELFQRYKNNTEFLLGAAFYALSPILMVNQISVFLYSVWIIALAPLFIYFTYKYIVLGKRSILLYSLVFFLFFSLVFLSIPWFLGFIIPIFVTLIVFTLVSKKFNRAYIFRFASYIALLIISQSFWFIPFVLNFLILKHGSYSSSVLSKSVSESFIYTVNSTASGNILYPLLNIFHRQIAFDYKWPLFKIFISFYDKIWWINLLFVLIIVLGIFSYKKLKVLDRKKYLFFLLPFSISLFLFTVNIDILKNIFLLGGIIPGFGMFRNFYDKFAFGFVFFYSIFFTISLIVVNERFKSMRKYINFAVVIVILINVIPIIQIVNKPLWKTKDIYTVITIPKEYTNFMNEMKSNVRTSSSILTLPYNIAGYSFIMDTDTNNVYAGTSPVVLFTGLNDFSGDLSFAGTDSATFKEALLSKNYTQIQNIMQKYAINYIFITNNLPKEFLKSYLFEPKILAAQDKTFLSSISEKLVLSSSKGNYQLYTAKHMTPLISGKNVTFQKLSPVKFRITIKNLKGNEALTYRDTYNGDWKLFPENTNSVKKCAVIANYSDYGTSECARGNSFTFGELQYLFIKSIPDTYHQPLNDFGNTWTVSESYIKKNFSKSTYTLNKDGSMDITFTLYFVPQTYFYIGTIVSVLTFAVLGGYMLFEYLNKRKK